MKSCSKNELNNGPNNNPPMNAITSSADAESV